MFISNYLSSLHSLLFCSSTHSGSGSFFFFLKIQNSVPFCLPQSLSRLPIALGLRAKLHSRAPSEVLSGSASPTAQACVGVSPSHPHFLSLVFHGRASVERTRFGFCPQEAYGLMRSIPSHTFHYRDIKLQLSTEPMQDMSRAHTTSTE